MNTMYIDKDVIQIFLKYAMILCCFRNVRIVIISIHQLVGL